MLPHELKEQTCVSCFPVQGKYPSVRSNLICRSHATGQASHSISDETHTMTDR